MPPKGVGFTDPLSGTLNAQFDTWRTQAEVHPTLKPLLAILYSAVLTIERRGSKEGVISVCGNYYSVPDTTRRRTFEIQHHVTELRIFEDGVEIARHPVIEGKNRRRIDPAHRKAPPARVAKHKAPVGVQRRPVDSYEAVGQRVAGAAS